MSLAKDFAVRSAPGRFAGLEDDVEAINYKQIRKFPDEAKELTPNGGYVQEE